jgi:hypothetical protein
LNKTWIKIDGMHVNLDTATTIEENGPQGTRGYKIFHGEQFVKVTLDEDKNHPKYNEYRAILTRIRFYLHNNQIPDVAGGGREEGQ